MNEVEQHRIDLKTVDGLRCHCVQCGVSWPLGTATCMADFGPGGPCGGATRYDPETVVAIIAAARLDGARTQNAWRLACAAVLVRVDSAIAVARVYKTDVRMVTGAIFDLRATIETLLDNEPYHTYEDGLREAADTAIRLRDAAALEFSEPRARALTHLAEGLRDLARRSAGPVAQTYAKGRRDALQWLEKQTERYEGATYAALKRIAGEFACWMDR